MCELKTQEDYCWIELAALLPDGGMVRNEFVQRDIVLLAINRNQFKSIKAWCITSGPYRRN
jgi:hypothetical protein